ncbi:MAG: single-stranded DNA-binding protein [Candidatus Brocadiia bacterium]
MSGFNKVILLGNCVREPELRYTPQGTAVTDFRLAVNRVFGTGESRKQETLFIDVQAWGKTAETLSRYLQKGTSVLVEGRLVLDQWESNGEKRQKIKVVAESFQFVSSRSSAAGGEAKGAEGEATPPPSPEPHVSGESDEVPF